MAETGLDLNAPPPDGLDAVVRGLSDGAAPLTAYLDMIWRTVSPQILSTEGLVELAVIVAAGALAFLFAGAARRLIGRLTPRTDDHEISRVGRALRGLAPPLLWLAALWIGAAALAGAGWPNGLARLAASLLTAWVVIRLVSTVVADPVWSRLFAVAAWTVAALNALRLLGPTIALLDGAAISVGDLRVSLYLVLKATALVVVLLWLATTLARIVNLRVTRAARLTESVRTLIAHGVHFGLILTAILIALNAVGIDLTAFAVLSGAIGVGLGFGLQKIVSNFVSGVIILLDGSIKPGDVVEVADTYGWVTSLGARFAAVRTRDGVEHLIPNEEFIINRVANWTHSDRAVRQRLPIGVAYDTDLDAALALIRAAVAKTPRVLGAPPVNVLVRGFGDSAIELEARFWIADPQNGVSNVASDCYLNVWRALKAAKIEIPFPQRDLHVRSLPSAPDAAPDAGADGAGGR
ncbi:mechanosensitive ion channel family protein [Pikeienuella sp. HZG-20]|uniref:mechanosensitive ion channel family protein n=1 Tax=Paludibacillus litoralis TaxID=3133267 RepID=UPI0030EB5D49